MQAREQGFGSWTGTKLYVLRFEYGWRNDNSVGWGLEPKPRQSDVVITYDTVFHPWEGVRVTLNVEYGEENIPMELRAELNKPDMSKREALELLEKVAQHVLRRGGRVLLVAEQPFCVPHGIQIAGKTRYFIIAGSKKDAEDFEFVERGVSCKYCYEPHRWEKTLTARELIEENELPHSYYRTINAIQGWTPCRRSRW